MDNKPKNRAWVKDAAIVFLVVLLILTFFSNTIMNRNLTEVATENVGSGTISAKVRGTGKVEANGSYQVKMEKTREIRAVMVKEGQTVEADDVLFILGEGSADEIEEAQNALRQLELSYKSTAIGMDSYDSAQDDYDLKQADAAIEKAEAALRDAEAQMVANTNVSPDSLNAAKTRLDQASENVKEKTAAVDKIRKGFADELSAAEVALTIAQTALDDFNDNNPVPVKGDDEEQSDFDARLAAYTTKKTELETAVTNAQNAKDAVDQKINDAVASEQTELDKAVEEYKAIESAYNSLIASAEGSGNYKTAYDEAKKALEDAKKSKKQLQLQIEQNKKSVYKAAAQTSLQLQDLKTQIEQAKAKLEELTGGVENEIRSNVAGTIDSIAYTAGSTVPQGEVICTINVPDMGYSLSFSVTNDQARRLHPGDSATVTNYYWGSQITATLSGMKTDPKNPQTNKLLTFNLEGDVNPGAELTISVGSKSASYDYVVPNGAIRSDSNGTFILLIESKSSALGNRYIARRMDVEILASDDTYSAISADLGWGEYVITTSKKPITSGEQVRIAES